MFELSKEIFYYLYVYCLCTELKSFFIYTFKNISYLIAKRAGTLLNGEGVRGGHLGQAQLAQQWRLVRDLHEPSPSSIQRVSNQKINIHSYYLYCCVKCNYNNKMFNLLYIALVSQL